MVEQTMFIERVFIELPEEKAKELGVDEVDYLLSTAITPVSDEKVWVKFSLWLHSTNEGEIVDSMRPIKEGYDESLKFLKGQIANYVCKIFLEESLKEIHIEGEIGVRSVHREQGLGTFLFNNFRSEISRLIMETDFASDEFSIVHKMHVGQNDEWGINKATEYNYVLVGDSDKGLRYEKELSRYDND